MGKVEMIMPKMGESVMEATVLSWLKNEGDVIEQDESVLEVATDKVDTEVPSTHAGVLSKILVQEGDVVPVGNPIAEITIEGEVDLPSNGSDQVEVFEEEEAVLVEETVTAATPVAEKATPSPGRFYSPLVLNIARQENIGM